MTDRPPENPSGYRLGDITIDLVRRRVRRGGSDIRLGKLSYRLLVVLARSAPAVVTRDQLAREVWNGRYVSQPTIKQRITLLRQALGDEASRPEYIRVVRGHGYTVIPAVEALHDPPAKKRWRPALAVAALVMVGVAERKEHLVCL